MKRISAFLLAMLLLFAMTGCSTDKQNQGGDTASNETSGNTGSVSSDSNRYSK